MKLRFSYMTSLLAVVTAVFLLVCLIEPFGGGAAWCSLVFTFGAYSVVRWDKRGLPLALLAAAILGAHAYGYKIYGSPEIIRVALVAPVTIERLELPNSLVLSDGSTRKLHGVKFVQPLSLRVEDLTLGQVKATRSTLPDENRPSAEITVARIWAMLRPSRRLNMKVGDGFEVELFARPDGSNNGFALRQHRYWCGNSFFATLFPRNLPSGTRIDLGELFVQAGAADPDTTDADYSAKLEQAAALRYHVDFY